MAMVITRGGLGATSFWDTIEGALFPPYGVYTSTQEVAQQTGQTADWWSAFKSAVFPPYGVYTAAEDVAAQSAGDGETPVKKVDNTTLILVAAVLALGVIMLSGTGR